MYDIISFGSASLDIFLKPKGQETIKSKKFITGKGICFNLGSKIEVEQIHFSSGGGGTNTAASFVKQGFDTAYCGAIGKDFAGEVIEKELESLKVNTDFMLKTDKKPTNLSVAISGLADDRTIFVYRGASEEFSKEDIDWDSLSFKWFYIAPLSGKLCSVFKDLILFAKKNNIKVALNPGNCQLSYPIEELKEILKNVNILFLNQEEASLLTKIEYNKDKDIFKKIDEICPGVAVMTRGPDGVLVSDGKNIYRALSQETEIIDRTGAGDAFASGFLSEYIHSKGNIEKAIQLGIANSTACISGWGAKANLLSKDSKYKKVKVEKENCQDNNLCQVKN